VVRSVSSDDADAARTGLRLQGKVNVDKNPKLAARYNVSSIPAFFIFKGGRIAARHLGVTSESVLRADLERLR
jgi:thioredoxin 1